MPKSITLIPDANGQLHLTCDGQEVVITVGAMSGAAGASANAGAGSSTGNPADSAPIQGGRSGGDPFGRWKHNTQLAPSVPDATSLPDGSYSFKTVDDMAKLSSVLDEVGALQDNSTTHVLRVLQSGSLDFHGLSELTQRGQSNVHVIIARKDE